VANSLPFSRKKVKVIRTFEGNYIDLALPDWPEERSFFFRNALRRWRTASLFPFLFDVGGK